MNRLVFAIKQFWSDLGYDVEVTCTAGMIESNLFRGLPRNAERDRTLPASVWIKSTEVLDRIKNPERVA